MIYIFILGISLEIEIASRWSAPEIVLGLNDFRIFSTKSDVYSFGIVLYELVAKRQIPFKGIQFW